jgi:hypothetical protein
VGNTRELIGCGDKQNLTYLVGEILNPPQFLHLALPLLGEEGDGLLERAGEVSIGPDVRKIYC